MAGTLPDSWQFTTTIDIDRSSGHRPWLLHQHQHVYFKKTIHRSVYIDLNGHSNDTFSFFNNTLDTIKYLGKWVNL